MSNVQLLLMYNMEVISLFTKQQLVQISFQMAVYDRSEEINLS